MVTAITQPATVGAGRPARGERHQLTTPGGAAPGHATDQPGPAAMELFELIRESLVQAGLGHLATVSPTGMPGGWLWDHIKVHGDSGARLTMALEQHPDWQARFAPIVEQRRRAAEGVPTVIMTARELMEYEAEAKAIFRNAGLPKRMWGDLDTIHQLVLNDISPNELADRLGSVFSRVRNVDPAIREAFENFYGVGNGDAELAAFFLDPDRTLASLEKQSRAAYTAGMGASYGIDIGRSRAERIARLPRTEGGIDEGLRQVAAMRTVFEAGITERGSLTAEREGLGSVFDGDAAASRELERRVARRRTADQSSVGGALQTREGIAGLRER